MKNKKLAIMRVQLDAGAMDSLKAISTKFGKTQISVASKLTQWFALQPDVIQAEILGWYPKDIRQEVANFIRKRTPARKGQ